MPATGEPSLPRRSHPRRLLALVLGTLVAVALAEVVYRVLFLGALSPTTNPLLVRHDAELGWSLRPGVHERHTTAEFDVEIAINSRGFRGPEWPAAKHGPRVLVLGDSFAFGWGVAWEQCFAARLQAANPDWEVLDAGVPGYGIDQQLLLARKLLPQLVPDAVVCVFCKNDLWESGAAVAYGKGKPRCVERDGEVTIVDSPVVQSWFERKSALWRALVKKAWEYEFASTARDPEHEWQTVQALYRALRDEIAVAPLLLVSSEGRLVELARRERGMHHLDVRPVLAAGDGPVTFAVDGHWNERGHRLVGAALGGELAELLRAPR